MSAADVLPLPEDVEAWLGWLASQRRAAPLTLQAYRRDLARLVELAAPRALTELSVHDIRRMAGRLHAAGLGSRSIGRALSSWRGFYRWLTRHRGLAANPVESVRPPKAPTRLPKALTPDQTAALLDAMPEEALDVRDRAMFEPVSYTHLTLPTNREV